MLKPDMYVLHVNKIDLLKLKENKIKLLCFDLDNTLDMPDQTTKKIDDNIVLFLDEVEKLGFEILIMSNNSIKGRVESFANIRNYNYIKWAKKPFQKEYKKSEIIKSYKKEQICFIGDKIVTDVIGGNIYGSHTILVDPLYPNKKHWYTNIMSMIESVFSKMIGFKRGNYYDNM